VTDIAGRTHPGLPTDRSAGLPGDTEAWAGDGPGGLSYEGIWRTQGSVEQRRHARSRRRFGVLMSAVWMIYLAYPVIAAFEDTGAIRVVALADLFVFAVVYLVTLTFAWQRSVTLGVRVLLLAGDTCLAVIAAVLLRDPGMTAGVYLVAAAATLFRGRAGLVLSCAVLAAAATR
jgi:hypothetical protein